MFAVFHITIQSSKEKKLIFTYQIYWKPLWERKEHGSVLYLLISPETFFPKKERSSFHFYLKADYWWSLKGWISTIFRAQSVLRNTAQMLALNTLDKTSTLSILIMEICKLRSLGNFNTVFTNKCYSLAVWKTTFTVSPVWAKNGFEKQNDLIAITHTKKREKLQLLVFWIYLVLGSDCKTAKLQPLGSVAILTARWTKVSFWSRILSYTLFVSCSQDTSHEEFWRFDTSSAKTKKRLEKKPQNTERSS